MANKLNPSYQSLQKDLLDRLEADFRAGKIPVNVCTPVADYINDNRLCLVTIGYTPDHINRKITTELIEPLRAADPRQYYYSPESFHITLLISAFVAEPPTFSNLDVQIIRQTLEKVLPKQHAIDYHFSGLFFGASNLAVRGYSSKQLQTVVLAAETELQKVGYSILNGLASKEVFFGHISFCRFTCPPNQAFIDTLLRLRKQEIGSVILKDFEFCSSNAVFSPAKTTHIARFELTR